MNAEVKKRPGQTTHNSTPKEAFRRLFGPPPLIDGESEEDYEAFMVQVRAAVGPVDAIEEILLQDVVYLMWEVQRLRRKRGKFLQFKVRDGLKPALEPFFGYEELREIVEAWERRDPDALKRVNALLKEAGLDMEHVTALALVQNLKSLEDIDRLVAAQEGRRNQALRELERHRESLARRLQSAAKEIEDADFRVVDTALDAPQCD